MFGRKKEITQKFIEQTKEEVEINNDNDEPKKEKIEDNLQPKDSDNFIFYGENNKFSKQLEIYATLKDPQEKIQKDKLVLILIDSTSSIEYLSMKICEKFSQFPEYQKLNGLRAINLTKLNDEKNLPNEGKVEDVLRNGDIIYLDLISNDIWIKVIINMFNVINKNSKLIVSMDVKIRNELTFKHLRYKLLKSGIMCFLDKYSKSENNFHYVVSELNLSTSVNGNIDENKLKTIDDLTIKQLFNFKSSIKLEIKFFPLEFILFQKLKILSVPKEVLEKNPLWNKFKQLRFRELLNIKKYQKEKIYIFNYFKKLFENKESLPKCYIYSIDEDININKSEHSSRYASENIINNSDNKDLDESENLRLSQYNNQFNKSIFNWSDIEKSSDIINTSSIIKETERMALFILPPKQERQDEIIIDSNKTKRQRKNRKITSKNLNFNLSEFEIGIISEENDEEFSGDTIEKRGKNKRKTSDFNYKNNLASKSLKNLNFEIIDKENEIEDDNIYSNLKPKKLKMSLHHRKHLCEDFDKFFEKEKFLENITEIYLISIEKGVLEKCIIPNFRNLKIEEKKIKTMNKKRKRKKLVDFSILYKSVFSIGRLNIELGIFSIFVLGILIFFSYLLADTYY